MKNRDTTESYDALVDEIGAVITGLSDAQKLQATLAALPGTRLDGIELPDGLREAVALVVDRRGAIVSHNSVAATLFDLAAGATLAQLTETRNAARLFLDGKSSSDDSLPLTLLAADGGQVLMLGVTHDTSGHIILQEVRRGLNDQVQARLAEAMRLSPGETRVYFQLLEGKPAAAIAQSLARTEGTVRQQIKAILAKAGLRSQVQLISLAYALSLTADRTARARGTVPDLALATAAVHQGARGQVGYHRIGLRGGVPVLFFHGALFGIAGHPDTQATAQALGLDIIAPERPGYGRTALPDSGDATPLAVAQARDILDSLQIGPVVVLAHDVGTRFATRFAVSHPGRAAAIIAAPATPPMQNWGQTRDMPLRHRANAWAAQNFPFLMDRLVITALSQIARKGVDLVPQLVFSDCAFDQAAMARPEIGGVLREMFALVWQQRGAGFRRDMHITNENWTEELRALRIPLIALHGAHSLTVSRGAVEKMAQTVPDGYFRLIDDAGHTLPVTHPALVLRHALAAGMRAGLAGSDHGIVDRPQILRKATNW